MKNFGNTLAAFVLGLLLVSLVLNVVFIPKAIRKQGVQLQAYDKPMIINQFEPSKQLETKHLINHPTLIGVDTAGIAVYSDTLKNQDVDIVFSNRIQGTLLSSKLVYKLKTPPFQPVILTPPPINRQRGRLYMTGTLEIPDSKIQIPNEFKLGLLYVPGAGRLLAGYQYGVNTGSHSITLGYKF